MQSIDSLLSARDRAVLVAVDAGRCDLVAPGSDLRVDGLWFCDQPRAHALVAAGLLAAGPGRGTAPARLTSAGRAALAA